jgi:Protein of unknown function (DUF3987)
MSAGSDEFPGDDPVPHEAKLASEVPAGEPGPFADPGGAFDALHVEADDDAPPASDVDAPPPLEPNLTHINAHLYSLFHPDFVMPYPDAWIEIAIANPKGGDGNTGPKASKHFSAFQLQEAAEYAMKRNSRGNNVYIGMALRQGETGPSGRATKKNVITAARAWADFDKAGDAANIQTFLYQRGLQAAEVVVTGTVPHRRLQVFFRLAGNVTPDQLEAVNETMKTSLGGNGDGVQNADRVMRLAGTVSYPPPHKVARGYVPEVTTLIANVNPRAYRPDELIGLITSKPEPYLAHNRKDGAAGGRRSSSNNGSSNASGGERKPGRSDAELEALLESSRKPGNWHNPIRNAIATMIGRGWSDSAIRLTCKPYCKDGADDKDLDDFIDRGRTKWDKPDEEQADGAGQAEPVDPVDLWGKFDPPSLSRGLLPSAIEEFAFERGATMGCDASGIAVGALAVCAGAIPDDIRLQPKRYDTEWLEAARLWVLEIGDPSTMKTPSILAATKPLRRIDAELGDKYQRELAAWLQLPKDEQKNKPKPKKLRAMIFDTTIESTQEILRDSPGGVLLEDDELAGWFDAMYKYSGARGAQKDRSFWLQAYNGGAKTVDRVTRGTVHISNLSVSILGGAQPGPIRKLADSGEDDGLLQRFIPLMVRPAVGGRDEAPGAAVVDYADLIGRLHGLGNPCGAMQHAIILLKFDDGALKIREELERKHLDLMLLEGLNRKLTSHFGKYNGIFVRLCVVWHCIEHVIPGGGGELPTIVTEDTARRVADFLHGFLKPHAIAFYVGVLGLANDHDRLANIADYILAHKLERISNRDVARGDRSMRGLKRHETEAIFEQLEALGWVARIAGSRPSDPPRWIVNPAVHQRFAERAEAAKKRREQDREMIDDLLKGDKA